MSRELKEIGRLNAQFSNEYEETVVRTMDALRIAETVGAEYIHVPVTGLADGIVNGIYESLCPGNVKTLSVADLPSPVRSHS